MLSLDMSMIDIICIIDIYHMYTSDHKYIDRHIFHIHISIL